MVVVAIVQYACRRTSVGVLIGNKDRKKCAHLHEGIQNQARGGHGMNTNTIERNRGCKGSS